MRFLVIIFALVATAAFANPKERDGWAVHPTSFGYEELIENLKSAVSENGMGVVTEAGPTGVAASRGVTIPDNRVIGVFNNQFAVTMLNASESAMIEAPVRFYVTEQPDGTATLSYKTPSLVFSPYADESPEVAKIAHELDAKFAAIAREAIE